MLASIRALQDRLLLRKHLPQQFTSEPLREFFKLRYSIDVGLYSYGCFDSDRIALGTTIGRYCSFANTARIFNGNHGIEFLSLHPYLYNVRLGCVDSEHILRSRCIVEDDAWVGHASIVLPHVRMIGRGSVIGAGSVVTRDVPRYAIVAGNPARLIRYRFPDSVIDAVESSKWWKLSVSELKRLIDTNPDMVFRPRQYFA